MENRLTSHNLSDFMPEIKTIESVGDLLSRGYWYTPIEIQGFIAIDHRKLVSESAITARIRDLRKPQYGGYIVISRPRAGHTAWEYKIAQPDEKAAA